MVMPASFQQLAHLFEAELQPLTHTRVGRRNRYTVHLDRPFRHPAQDGLQVGPFLELLGGTATGNE